MYENRRENKGTSEFQTRFVERDGGVFFELEQSGGPGTVSLSSGPHKSLEAARGAATKMVREILRARIAASGIGRRGERPAFVDPRCCPRCGSIDDCHCADVVGGGERPAFRPYGTCIRCGGSLGASGACRDVACERAAVAQLIHGPGGQAALEPKATWVPPTVRTIQLEGDADHHPLWGDPMEAPPLEDEQLCSCGHVDGVHMLGTNACARAWCPCVEFEAAPAVEAVQ